MVDWFMTSLPFNAKTPQNYTAARCSCCKPWRPLSHTCENILNLSQGDIFDDLTHISVFRALRLPAWCIQTYWHFTLFKTFYRNVNACYVPVMWENEAHFCPQKPSIYFPFYPNHLSGILPNCSQVCEFFNHYSMQYCFSCKCCLFKIPL